MSTYLAALPTGYIAADYRDVDYRARATAMPAPDSAEISGGMLAWHYETDPAPTADVLAAWLAAVADPTPPPAAIWNIRATLEAQARRDLAAAADAISTSRATNLLIAAVASLAAHLGLNE